MSFLGALRLQDIQRQNKTTVIYYKAMIITSMYFFNTYSSIIPYLHRAENNLIWGHGYATSNCLCITKRNKQKNKPWVLD